MSYPVVTSSGGYPMVGQSQGISTPALPQAAGSQAATNLNAEMPGMSSSEQSTVMGAMQYQNPWAADSKPGMRGPLDYPQ